jgi:hypothetical protein
VSVARVVAWADLRPASLVVSALALRKSLGAEAKVAYSVLASGLRLDIAKRVKRLLEDRGVQFDLKEDPGWDRPQGREAEVAALLEEAGKDGRCQLALDILTRSFEPTRTVERNAGTLWGRAWTSTSTLRRGRRGLRPEEPALRRLLQERLPRGEPVSPRRPSEGACGRVW